MSECSNSIEPLEPTIWFASFESVSQRARGLSGQPPEQLLRHVFHLLQLTPGPLKDLFEPGTSEAEFERLLECGAYIDAVFALIGPGLGYKLSKARGNFGESRVAFTISLGDENLSYRAESTHLAVAFLIAFSDCIRSLAASAAEIIQTPPLRRRTDQFERRRQGTLRQSFALHSHDESRPFLD